MLYTNISLALCSIAQQVNFPCFTFIFVIILGLVSESVVFVNHDSELWNKVDIRNFGCYASNVRTYIFQQSVITFLQHVQKKSHLRSDLLIKVTFVKCDVKLSCIKENV